MGNKKLKLDELNRVSVEAFKEQEKFPVYVVLDNVRSAHNVGSIFRSADAFNVKELILLGITPNPPHREILKTALGATESVKWRSFTNSDEFISWIKENKLKMVCVEQTNGSESLQNFTWEKGMVLVFGNEVEGVESKLIEQADFCVEIPQFGTKHSFNVAVTAGICLWDFYVKMTFK